MINFIWVQPGVVVFQMVHIIDRIERSLHGLASWNSLTIGSDSDGDTSQTMDLGHRWRFYLTLGSDERDVLYA